MGRAMKDSGVEWIGEIPEAWNVFPMKSVIISNDGGIWGNDPVGDGTDKVVIRSTEQSIDGKWQITSPATRNLSGFNVDTYRILPGDLLITKSSGSAFHIGKTTIADQYFAEKECYYSNFIQRVRVNQFAKYYWYILNSTIARDQFVYLQNTTSGIGNINAKDIEKIYVPLPSVDEQYSISRFLDEQCAKIDTIIAKALASIEEYKHLKQAVITQAITKGVRGERPMKESGIAWIDKIPQELRITRVGMLFDIILGKMLCSTPIDNSYTLEPYYCAADVHFDGISSETERKQMWFSPAEKDIYLVKSGDLLIVEGGAGAGGCAIVANQTKPTYIQNSIMIVRQKERVSVNYLRYWIECLVKQGYIDVVCNKATIPHFTKEKLANVPIPVFSSAESVEIASYLNEKCAEIDALITQKEQLLTELENYKKSLIYEYVTGKKEVPS